MSAGRWEDDPVVELVAALARCLQAQLLDPESGLPAVELDSRPRRPERLVETGRLL